MKITTASVLNGHCTLINSEQFKHICLRLKFSFVWIICGLTFRCRKWFLYFVQADLFVHLVSHLQRMSF